MKAVVLTDIHGNIDIINQLVCKYHADIAVVCGDVGFFDRISIQNMPSEELIKIIRHAPISSDEKSKVYSLAQAEQADFLLQNHFAGMFEEYLNGKKQFVVPVYAVWGNHEDIRIVNQLRAEPLANLTLLDEKTSVKFENIRLYGLGGNFNGKHLTMAKKNGIPWIRKQISSAFWQYDELVKMLDEYPQNETRIQITHCDPVAESFLDAVARRCGAKLTLSGHMHRKEAVRSESTGSSVELFRRYVEQYPALPWKNMLRDTEVSAVEHFNLSPAEPLVLEMEDSEYRINNQNERKLQ